MRTLVFRLRLHGSSSSSFFALSKHHQAVWVLFLLTFYSYILINTYLGHAWYSAVPVLLLTLFHVYVMKKEWFFAFEVHRVWSFWTGGCGIVLCICAFGERGIWTTVAIISQRCECPFIFNFLCFSSFLTIYVLLECSCDLL